jgi:hypothetical protein
MNIYSIALFLHVVGALGFFVVLGIEWMGLWQIRSAATPEEARAILGLVKRTTGLGIASILTTIVTGIYMLLTVWGAVAWILVVLGALASEIALFVTLTAPRIAAIRQALVTEKRSLSPAFQALINHPMIWISMQTRVAIILGIVFLKFAKPGLGASLLIVVAAIVLGLGSALPVIRNERTQTGPAD